MSYEDKQSLFTRLIRGHDNRPILPYSTLNYYAAPHETDKQIRLPTNSDNVSNMIVKLDALIRLGKEGKSMWVATTPVSQSAAKKAEANAKKRMDENQVTLFDLWREGCALPDIGMYYIIVFGLELILAFFE